MILKKKKLVASGNERMEHWLSLFHASVAVAVFVMVIALASSTIVLAARATGSPRLQKDGIQKEVRMADVAVVPATLGVVFALVAVCIAIDNDPLLEASNVPLAIVPVSGGSVITSVLTLTLRWELRDFVATLHDG